MSLLEVRDLSVTFDTDGGTVHAVDGVSFDVDRGETVCIVGESGSGKTVTSESITRLVREPPGKVEASRVSFEGEDLSRLSAKRLRTLRGDRIAHVFQNPQGSLNPVYTVGKQIIEAIRLHEDVSKADARTRAIDLLDRVGIPKAGERIDDYPHEFSGGQKQRVVIAMAIAASPDLLIADEPTTALDVTIQAQILRLLRDLQDEYGMAMLLITHDLGVVAEIADRVVVMYAGKVMETGDVYEIFESPSHPYTKALLECLPGRRSGAEGIPGTLPDPKHPPDGCRFANRCPHAIDDCREGDHPPLVPVADGSQSHEAACIYYQAGYDASTVRNGPVGETGGAEGWDDEATTGWGSGRTDGGTDTAEGGAPAEPAADDGGESR
ncbi:ABC transporter ATP-binding protein [Haloarchaeobius amylolyticus]|uniref:ABC transporter ATP-binding protein n=1 Tax=Haloarchaeobius amylolyticus TaxID=1198296 RepID=UPI00226D8E7B|nr:ABC transporter ATP-binding protein [Haloarchaeobius amylolyticus]